MRAEIERVLRANGLSDKPAEYDSDIHSWRCAYPDIYEPCSCFQELVDDLSELLTPDPLITGGAAHDVEVVDQRPCGGTNSNICVGEGCYGEACIR